METPRLNKQGFVGLLPDGKHCVVATKIKGDAFIAICGDCAAHFDNDDPSYTVAKGVELHRRSTGHGGFVYYAMAISTKGATALDSAPNQAAASSSV